MSTAESLLCSLETITTSIQNKKFEKKKNLKKKRSYVYSIQLSFKTGKKCAYLNLKMYHYKMVLSSVPSVSCNLFVVITPKIMDHTHHNKYSNNEKV